MPSPKPTTTYPRLRTAIQTTLADGHLRAQEAVERERLRTYWQVGDHLVRYLETNPASHGSQVVKRLSEDVGLSTRTLYYIMRFRRSVTKVQSIAKLSWSHYVKLVEVPEADDRERLMRLAEQNRWTVSQLRFQIAAERRPDATDASRGQTSLRVHRGTPYLYRVIEKPRIGLVIDQGFGTYTEPPASLPKEAGAGAILRSVRRGSSYRLEMVTGIRRLWTFVAWIDRVIDGDTVSVTIDTGFGDYVDETLRLRGIDTPEMDTPDGRRARRFVADAIGSLDRIVISTSKSDKYDRYLADILYAPGTVTDPHAIARTGTYLNRELIEQGLATRYV